MSEEERSRRLGYRIKRKRLITAQVILVAVMLVIALLSAILMMFFDKTYYVNYVEKSSVNYGVHLKENDYYEDDFLGKDYAYIASLIDKVEAKFDYGVTMQSEEAVDFDYTYRVDSVLEIKDRATSRVLYAPTYNEIPAASASVSGTKIDASRTVFIDYDRYNSIADEFINVYDLKNADATLIVRMVVDVKGRSDEFFGGENSKSHVASISIPLRQDTVEIKITSSVPQEAQKILSYTTKNISDIFKLAAISAAALALLLGIILWLYAFLSRNVDVTYDIKVAKILRSYKSFIQRIRNSFNTDGYKLLLIDSFDDMLAIRDTIQSPILMEENADKTCSRFYIPSGAELLYLFEIKVDDYDLIYGVAGEDGETDAPASEPLMEEIVSVEEIPAAAVTDADTDGGSDTATLEYVNEAGERVSIACNRSFTANLIQSNPTVKGYYTAIKNRFLSYRGVKARISWRNETFNRGRNQLAKLKIRGKTICLYLALDPEGYDKARYFHEATDAKCFAAVPMMIRIKSDRGLGRALTLIDAVMARFEIEELPTPDAYVHSDGYPYESTSSLVDRGLIKILVPGGVAAEPAAHHHLHKKD